MNELLIGCGSRRNKLLFVDNKKDFENVVTLDNNKDHNPDFLWNLKRHPLPFKENTFDEIHAYEVLEHLAQQGDFVFFFAEFSEYWRILKPGGMFFATVPSIKSRWLWGDPSHTRAIMPETLVFLDQSEYAKQVGKTPMSDFRYLYKADFQLIFSNEDEVKFSFVLKAKK